MAATGTFTGTGQSTALFIPEYIASPDMGAPFNLNVSGTFVATFQLERSFDGGATWNVLTALGTPITFTAACSEVFTEPESGVQYRVNCTAYTSGTITYRLSQ